MNTLVTETSIVMSYGGRDTLLISGVGHDLEESVITQKLMNTVLFMGTAGKPHIHIIYEGEEFLWGTTAVPGRDFIKFTINTK